MAGEDTRERLLNAAEQLFAEQGIAVTTLRALTRAAGVNLAAVHYHFGGKEGLLDAVVERRAIVMNRERLRDLDQLIRRGEFREDLFYRLNVMRIHLPPLRQRPLDVLPLALRFLHEAADTCLGQGAKAPELTQSAVEALQAHTWPGNVRELQNAMVRALVVSTGDWIQAHHLGLAPQGWRGPAEAPGLSV